MKQVRGMQKCIKKCEVGAACMKQARGVQHAWNTPLRRPCRRTTRFAEQARAPAGAAGAGRLSNIHTDNPNSSSTR